MSFEERKKLLKKLLEKDLYGNFFDDIADVMGNMTDDEKENYTKKINEIIDSYQTESEIRGTARKAGLLK